MRLLQVFTLKRINYQFSGHPKYPNVVKGEPHRASKISSSFNVEVNRIRQKFLNVGFPKHFIESVIKDFQGITDDDVLIPEWLFDERIVKTLKLPLCSSNEFLCKHFIEKLQNFTNNKFKFRIIWDTRNVRSLFPLKRSSQAYIVSYIPRYMFVRSHLYWRDK